MRIADGDLKLSRGRGKKAKIVQIDRKTAVLKR